MKKSSLQDLQNKLQRTTYAIVEYHLMRNQESMEQNEANSLFKIVAKGIIGAVRDLNELRKKKGIYKQVIKELKKKKVLKKRK